MTKVISIHSFRSGTGKSNITANLAVILAGMNKRIGIVDVGLQSPGIQVIFGKSELKKQPYLNDYLHEKQDGDVVHDVTKNVDENIPGKIFLIASNPQIHPITSTHRESYDPALLAESFQILGEKQKLDVILIDTCPGINEETLISMAISDTVLMILRPEQQDYLGTSVTVELARRLQVKNLLLLVNKAPHSLDAAQINEKVQETYQCPVAAVIPNSEEMLLLGSAGVFAAEYPNDDITKLYKQTAKMLLA